MKTIWNLLKKIFEEKEHSWSEWHPVKRHDRKVSKKRFCGVDGCYKTQKVTYHN